jgi:hypothetical protein
MMKPASPRHLLACLYLISDTRESASFCGSFFGLTGSSCFLNHEEFESGWGLHISVLHVTSSNDDIRGRKSAVLTPMALHPSNYYTHTQTHAYNTVERFERR